MFNLIFLVTFSLILLFLNIYCFIKKKYLYLFVPCMLFLPDYYGIEFSKALPLLTVSRIMFLIFYIYAYINRKKQISIKKIRLKSIPCYYYFLFGYFFFRFVANIYYISIYKDAIKTTFEIFFEQLLFLVAIYLLAPTKNEIITIIKIIVWTAFAFFIIGILESFTFFRPFDALYTVTRFMHNQHFVRLGLLRSTTTFGLPGFYGNMCLLMFPLITYIYNLNKSKKYLVILFFDILALIHSGSRADIIFLLILTTIYLVHNLIEKKILSYLKIFAIILTSLIIFITSLSLVNNTYKYFYFGVIKSTLNELGFDFDLNQVSSSEDNYFGENNDYGTESRLVQFTGIIHTLRINPLFGLGSKPLSRNAVSYYSFNKWHTAKAFDVGVVEVICSEGFIGLIAHIFLFIFFVCYLNSISRHAYPFFYSHIYFLIISYLLCILGTANMYSFLILIIFLLLGYTQFCAQ